MSSVIVALDYCSESEALGLVDRLDPSLCRLKVGKELFTACGPSVVKKLVARNFDVFLDLKFHDIPNTVNKALKSARDLGVWMVNVHASGGARMLEAARAAYNSDADPILIAVTVLTSMEESDLRAVGIDTSMEQHIHKLARLAVDADLDGVVCSARETAMLREVFGDNFCLVTPGIRPAYADPGDQRRVVTPAEAIRLGSDYLVIGRPVTEASDPLEALKSINESVYLDVT